MAFRDASEMPAEEFQTLVLSEERTEHGTILWVTLNRPKAFNAISMVGVRVYLGSLDSIRGGRGRSC